MSEGQGWVLIGAVVIGIGVLGQGHLHYGGELLFIFVGSFLVSHGFQMHYREKRSAELEKRRRS